MLTHGYAPTDRSLRNKLRPRHSCDQVTPPPRRAVKNNALKKTQQASVRIFCGNLSQKDFHIKICNSFPVIRTASAKNHCFHVPQPTFLFPLETPLRLSRNMLHGWKDNWILAKPIAACTHLCSTVSQLFEPQVQKIAVYTYRSPLFCFPWRRHCESHAICSMDGIVRAMHSIVR